MPLDCRLIVDEPAEGAWNMAVDEALLERAAEGGPATLRLYRWAEPTLSLGYFQAYADRAGHPPSDGLPCVRRSSGGGALVHDREVTYSLTLPPEALRGRETRGLYCAAHRAVIDTISTLGGDPAGMTLCDPAGGGGRPSEEPFLCFLRRADGDLLVAEPPSGAVDTRPVAGRYKVTGSAQRKRRGALLQHGGVLLAQSPHAPELPGLAELGVIAARAEAFAESLAGALAKRLELDLSTGGLTTTETAGAERLRAEKHLNPGWVRRR